MSTITAVPASASVSADLRHVVVVSRKTPIALAIITALAALLYALAPRPGYTHFRFSESGDPVHVPTLTVDGMTTAWLSVVIITALVVVSVAYVAAKRKVPVWVPIVFALVAIVGFLAWAGAGSTAEYPVVSLLRGSMLLAVPLVFGAMGGVIGERAGDQALPGQRPVMPGRRIGEHAVKGQQRLRERPELRLPALDADRQQRERREQAAGRGVGRELAQEGLRVDGAVQQVFERLGLQEQERIALEIRAAVRAPHRAEMRVVLRQRGGERGGRFVGRLRRRRIDHADQQVLELRERPLPRDLPLPPGQGGGEHRIGVGRDGEMRGAEPRGPHGEQKSGEQHQRRVPPAVPDQGGKQMSQEHAWRGTGSRVGG